MKLLIAIAIALSAVAGVLLGALGFDQVARMQDEPYRMSPR